MSDINGNNGPLVSIGLPVYNRELMVRQALVSALEQGYRNLEIIVSDNASTDGTEQICRELAAQDNRLKYIRQDQNRGPTANFNEVFSLARGKYFMWLGDDDWVDSDYVEHCVRVLEAHPDYAVVGGQAHYYQGEEWLCAEDALHITNENAASRVVHYYAEVNWNGLFYGLMRRDFLERVAPSPTTPLSNRIGDDWIILAAMAFLGKMETLSDVKVHRRLGGASQSHVKTAAIAGLGHWAGRYPHQSIAFHAACHILASPVYAPLGRIGRWKLAWHSQKAMLQRHVWQQAVERGKETARHRLLPLLVRLLQAVTPQRVYKKMRSSFGGAMRQNKANKSVNQATILLISPLAPWPVAHGSQLRLRNLLLWLRGEGYRTVLFVETPELSLEARREIERLTDVVWSLEDTPLWSRAGLLQRVRQFRIFMTSIFPVSWRDAAKNRLRSVRISKQNAPATRQSRSSDEEVESNSLKPEEGRPRHLPPISHFGASPQSVTVARAMGKQFQPAAAIVAYAFNSECLDAMPHSTLKIIDTLDRQADKSENAAAFGITGLWTCTREEERRRLLRSDVVLAIQSEEAAYFRDLVPEREVLVVGVDQQVEKQESAIVPERVLLISSDNPLNQHGVTEFFQNAWPRLCEMFPAVKWRVVGGIGEYMPATASDDDRIEIVGRVEDVNTEYQQAAVVINPTRFGTGLKIKTVEALSHGKALVTWHPGVEGLHWTDEAPCIVVNSWEEFADAVACLLLYEKQRESLQDIALQFAFDNFDARQAYTDLRDRLQRHLAERGTAQGH